MPRCDDLQSGSDLWAVRRLDIGGHLPALRHVIVLLTQDGVLPSPRKRLRRGVPMLNIVRWIGVFPAALIGAVLSLFPLHLILYQTLTDSGIAEPYPETPEQLLSPFVAAIAFVWMGIYVAPNRKAATAVVTFGVWLLFTVTFLALAIADVHVGNIQFYLEGGILRPIGSIAGAFVGLYLVRRGATDCMTPEAA